MAITLDAHSNSGNQTDPAPTSITWAHTCAANARLYVACSDQNAGGASRITGVTYNGSALTRAITKLSTNAGSSEIFYIDNPSTGAHNIIVSASTNSRLLGGATSFLGAAAASLGATNGNNSTSIGTTSLSVSLTTTNANAYIYSALDANSIVTLTSTGTNQTNRFSVQQTTDGETFAGATQTTTTAGSYTNSFSYSAGASGSVITAVEVIPAATATGNYNFLSFMPL